jgi:hypothetical protein
LKPENWLSVVKVIIPLSILLLVLLPTKTWITPETGFTLSGFDPNLIYIDEKGNAENPGIVEVKSDSLNLTALAGSQPTVHLITSPLSYIAEFDAEIVNTQGSAHPLQVKLWTPRTDSGFHVWFPSSPQGWITSGVVINGALKNSEKRMMPYTPHETYHFKIEVTKGSRIALEVSTPERRAARSIKPDDAPEIFEEFRLSLTVFATGLEGSSTSMLRNFRIKVPSQTIIANATSDWRLPLIYAAIIALIALAYVKELTEIFTSVRGRLRKIVSAMIQLAKSGSHLSHLKFGGTALLFLIVNFALFGLGNHPFDIYTQKAWAYVSGKYGVESLYYLTNITTAAKAFGGIPYQEAGFSYLPLMGYYFSLIGWVYRILFNPAGLILDTFTLEYIIKTFNILFGLLDGFLVYCILRKIGVASRAAFSSMLLFLFNPALIFDMSIWGQTETILLFFLLLAIFAIVSDRPKLTWVFLVILMLTKPTAILFAPFIAIVAVKKFGFRQSAKGVSIGISIAFLLILPLLLAHYSPSLLIDPFIYNASAVIGSGGGWFRAVSVDAFSLWPLVTLFVNHAPGLARMAYPDFAPTALFGLTYQDIGKLTFALFASISILTIVFANRMSIEKGRFLPIVALAVLASLLFPTRSVSRYFLFPLSLIILSRKHLTNFNYYLSVGILSFTTFLSIYGVIIGSANLYPELLPHLNLYDNPVSSIVWKLYASDWGITLGCLLNLGVFIALLASVFRDVREGGGNFHSFLIGFISRGKTLRGWLTGDR